MFTHTDAHRILNEARYAKDPDESRRKLAELAESMTKSLGIDPPKQVPTISRDEVDDAIDEAHACLRRDDVAGARAMVIAIEKAGGAAGAAKAAQSGRPRRKKVAKKKTSKKKTTTKKG